MNFIAYFLLIFAAINVTYLVIGLVIDWRDRTIHSLRQRKHVAKETVISTTVESPPNS